MYTSENRSIASDHAAGFRVDVENDEGESLGKPGNEIGTAFGVVVRILTRSSRDSQRVYALGDTLMRGPESSPEPPRQTSSPFGRKGRRKDEPPEPASQ